MPDRRRIAAVVAVTAAVGIWAGAGSGLAAPAKSGVATPAVGAAAHAKLTATQTAILTAAAGETNDSLGVSVAVSGTTIVAGADNRDDGAGEGEGAAYVFEEPPGGWGHAARPVARLTPSDGAAGDLFGTSVAIVGTTIVVGSPFHGSGGAVYVFTEPTGGWHAGHETAELTGGGDLELGGLGESVAISGRTVVGGAPYTAVGSNTDQGAAAVFTEPVTGWPSGLTSSATLTASDGAEDDGFGGSVAIGRGTVVVGAPAHEVDLNAREGAAYVYVQPAGGWSGSSTDDAELEARDAKAKSMVGSGVAIDPTGHTVVVGAGGGDPDVYVEPATGWVGVHHETADLTGAGAARSDNFGISVAISGRTILAGAPLQTTGLVPSAGAAYAFVRSGPTWRTTSHPGLVAQASFPNYFDELGGQVAVAPGLLVAGARERDVNGRTDAGAVFVFSAPTISAVTASRSVFYGGSTLPTVNPRRAPVHGTVLRFAVDQTATVHVSFAAHRHGRLRGAGSFDVAIPAGRIRLAFAGRLSTSRELRPGRYVVSLRVLDAIGSAAVQTVHLTVRSKS